jgi:hypothetical protein
VGGAQGGEELGADGGEGLLGVDVEEGGGAVQLEAETPDAGRRVGSGHFGGDLESWGSRGGCMSMMLKFS